MESNFQTTFIPKKPMSPRLVPGKPSKRYSTNIFSVSSAVIFLIALATSVGFFIWNLVLAQKIGSLTEQIAEARASFEPETIERLREVDMQIRRAKQIVASHTDPSGLFEILASDTLRNVAFRNFIYTTTGVSTAKVVLTGEALDFSTLALQADVFAKNTQVINPVFSHFGKTSRRLVTFDFEAGLNPMLIAYRAPAGERGDTVPTELTPTTTGSTPDDASRGETSATSTP